MLRWPGGRLGHVSTSYRPLVFWWARCGSLSFSSWRLKKKTVRVWLVPFPFRERSKRKRDNAERARDRRQGWTHRTRLDPNPVPRCPIRICAVYIAERDKVAQTVSRFWLLIYTTPSHRSAPTRANPFTGAFPLLRRDPSVFQEET